MLVDYPYEWRRYMLEGKVRTFSSETPEDIIEKAKEINKKAIEYEGKPYFFFIHAETKNQPNEMDKIIHGLDLPDDISEKNNEIIMKQLGITEDDILAEKDEEMEYLCNQKKDLELLNNIRNMTDDEFNKYIEEFKQEQLNKDKA